MTFKVRFSILEITKELTDSFQDVPRKLPKRSCGGLFLKTANIAEESTGGSFTLGVVVDENYFALIKTLPLLQNFSTIHHWHFVFEALCELFL